MTENSTEKIEQELKQFRERYHRLNKQIRERGKVPGWYTSNKTVFELGSMRVLQFEGSDEQSHPVLIVYSQVNQPNVLDLHERHSMVQRLIESGAKVYLLDWGETEQSHCHNDLSLYAVDYISAAIDFIANLGDGQKVNMIGICQGGTFALCYASLYPKCINKLVTVVTPVDFHAGNSIIAHWVKHVDFSFLERNPRNIPGKVITNLFQIIRPLNDLQRQVHLIDQPEDVRNLELVTLMDHWIYNCPDQPGTAFAQFITWLYQENKLVNNNLVLGQQPVKLGNISIPVLNVFAQYDHLVPAESAKALGKYIDPDLYHEKIFAGGHIGLLVSSKAQQTIIPEIGSWLASLN